MNDTTHELLARLIQQDLIARLMQKVEDTMCDADVDFPAGREAGARVSYNSDSLQRCFEVEMEAAPDLHRIITEQAAEIERLREALGLIANHRYCCHAHDDDMGHPLRAFDEEDVKIMEYAAKAALKVKP